MDGQHLVYSTSEIMTHFVQGSRDVALLYGRDGEVGETVLRYASRPTVKVVSGTVASTYDAATGDLRLDYVHNGLAEVRISGGGRAPLTLLLADNTTADAFWRQDTDAGPVLEEGPELVRTASVDGLVLRLTGDTSAATTLKVWAPPQIRLATWNGRPAALSIDRGRTPAGAVVTARLPGPAPVSLPDLSTARWKYAPESPEAQPSFDDSSWQVADKTTTNSTTPPSAGQPVLTADDYGFHQGDVWYRGVLLGRRDGDDPDDALRRRRRWIAAGVARRRLPRPERRGERCGGTARRRGRLRSPFRPACAPMGRTHWRSWSATTGTTRTAASTTRRRKAAASSRSHFADANQAAVNPQITWRIQGNLGGEDIADPARGVENNGGLYGERHGWYLPGYPDGDWTTATVPASTAMSGTAWYRTTFSLHIPTVDDASLGITIGDPSTPQSSANYRALIFVNGWNMGQYIADVGPQHTFVHSQRGAQPRRSATRWRSR